MKAPDILPGTSYDLPYPFARSTYEAWDGDESGQGVVERPTWKPGVRHADKGEGDVQSIADALGRQILTVVSTHKPGRYPLRVFFTREWVNPDGQRFGSLACRVTPLATFRTLTRGYRHEFVLHGCQCEGCKWPHHDHRNGEELKAEREAYQERQAVTK
jgi:hypothetical protein